MSSLRLEVTVLCRVGVEKRKARPSPPPPPWRVPERSMQTSICALLLEQDMELHISFVWHNNAEVADEVSTDGLVQAAREFCAVRVSCLNT